MKTTYLKFALPVAFLTANLAFGDEITKQQSLIEQEDENNYARASLDFDIFCAPTSFNTHHPIYNENGYHIGTYRIHGKQTNKYKGVRLTWDWLKPNDLYIGLNFLFAGGNIHRKGYVNGKKFDDTKIDSNIWLNNEVSLGYNFKPSNTSGFLLSVFAGPGYHFEKKFNHDARWYYGMAGFKIAQDLTKSLSVGVDFKTMYSYNLLDDFGITSFERKDDRDFWGIELGTPITWNFGEERRFDLQIKPYVLKYNINSNVTILGTTLGFGYTY